MAKTLGMVFGVIFVLVGLLGFVSNPIVGDMGYFHTDLIHNLVHIIIGAVLIIASRKGEMMASKTLKVVAIVYVLLALVGFFMDGDKLLGLVAANDADNWLHLVLGVVLWAGAMIAGKKTMPMGSPMGSQQM